MNVRVYISAAERAIVQSILDRCLPPGYRTYVFGSRAGGRLTPWSDLDLAIKGPEPLSLSVLGDLREEFDEALLPWKVDVVDLSTISDSFAEIVNRHKVPLDPGETSPSGGDADEAC